MQGFFWSAVDDRARLRIKVSGEKHAETLIFEIDTGASEELFMSEDAADHLGIQLASRHWATLADGSQKVVMKGRATIQWLAGDAQVEVTVWPRAGEPLSPSKDKNRIDGLVGRRLLKKCCLTIDYVNRTVSITQPTAAGA